MEPQSLPPEFFGTPGQPVPEVAVDDMKACWQVMRECQDSIRAGNSRSASASMNSRASRERTFTPLRIA
jgi:hypothetical protein